MWLSDLDYLLPLSVYSYVHIYCHVLSPCLLMLAITQTLRVKSIYKCNRNNEIFINKNIRICTYTYYISTYCGLESVDNTGCEVRRQPKETNTTGFQKSWDTIQIVNKN